MQRNLITKGKTAFQRSLTRSFGAPLRPSLVVRSCTQQFSFPHLEKAKYHRYFSTEASTSATSSPDASPDAETMSFQAETRKLLDIVTHSIYTDKEVFLRELVSNASDALEKFRYYHSTGMIQSAENDSSAPLEINIITNETDGTLTIVDNGIGMSRDELISNLGTIARSGSKQFVEQLSKGENPSGASKEGIIGQFGVGFYSSFMVADQVSVESLSAQGQRGNGHKWSSDGSGVFKMETVPSIEQISTHGSKVTMKLRENCKEYNDPERIKTIIKHYSNFVSFPIKVNGEIVNTVQAIWLKDKREISKEDYSEFYKYIANAGFDEPKYTLHFRTDAPIDLKCILFVPTHHSERFGQGTMEPWVNLYSRKVLIESKPKDLLPDWLRFLKGVVDSEDLPLSLSREKPQDSNLLRRIRDVLVRKFLKFLEDEQKKNPEEYLSFYSEYNMFLKQGICQDYKYMDVLSKLVMFESSAAPANKMITFDDYISRCPPEQKEIYYLSAPTREAALASPYYEAFKKNNKEVLLLYNTVDDFVMGNIRTYAGKLLG
jgi:TNF receptor-associated protein 1